MRKAIGIIMIILLFGGSICGVIFGVKYKNSIDTMYTQEQVEQIKEDVKNEWADQEKDYVRQIEECLTALEDFQERFSETSNSLITLQGQYDELLEKYNQSVVENQPLHEEIENLNNEVASLKELNSSYVVQVNALTEEITKLELQIDELLNYKEDNSTSINELNSVIAELNSKISEFESIKIEYNTQIALLNNSIESYKNEIENYKDIIEDLKEINSSVVTFSFDGQIISTQQVNKTEFPTEVEIPSSGDYVFDGWMLKGTSEIIDPYTYSITQDTEFVASLRKYKNITFIVDDEPVSTQQIIENTELVLPENPVKEHYLFLGWSLDGSNVIDITSYEFIQDTNLIAVFEITGVLPFTFSTFRVTSYTGNAEHVVIPSSYSIVEGVYVEGDDHEVTALEDSLFEGNETVKSIVISEGITHIGVSCFQRSSLEEIVIPTTLKGLGNLSFQRCKNLKTVYYNAINANDLNEISRAFYWTDDGEGFDLIIGNEVQRIPDYFCYVDDHLQCGIKSIKFEEGSVCTSIGRYAFYNCPLLGFVEIPSSITSIGGNAFRTSGGSAESETIIIDSLAVYNKFNQGNYSYKEAGYLIDGANEVRIKKDVYDNASHNHAYFENGDKNFQKTIIGDYYVFTLIS